MYFDLDQDRRRLPAVRLFPADRSALTYIFEKEPEYDMVRVTALHRPKPF